MSKMRGGERTGKKDGKKEIPLVDYLQRMSVKDLAVGRQPAVGFGSSLQRDSAFSSSENTDNVPSRGQRVDTCIRTFLGADVPDSEAILVANEDGRVEALKTQADTPSIENITVEDEDVRIERLLSRLKATQGQFHVHDRTPPAEFRAFYHDPYSAKPDDVPERFQSGRESLSVKRNNTVRGSKRPKERSQDREYMQRYSLTPSKFPVADQFGGGRQPSITPGHHSSSAMFTSPSRDHFQSSTRSPQSVPSPKLLSSQARRPTNVGRKMESFTITLICEGIRHSHDVWEDKPVDGLLQEAAVIFGIQPTIIVLMLFGLNPSTLRAGHLLSDPPPVVTDGWSNGVGLSGETISFGFTIARRSNTWLLWGSPSTSLVRTSGHTTTSAEPKVSE